MVSTCRNHNRGTQKIYTPCQPNHILPSKSGNQLCHAVINAQTIRLIKASKFCTTFQIHEQQGFFQGVDTCDLRKYGDFSFCSILLDESETRTIT